MRTILLILSLSTLISFDGLGQKLSLRNLTKMCNKETWEEVNQTLLAKGWTFYDSEKGETNRYNTITWSFNKDYYSDKAQGWLHLYTYEDVSHKISYSTFNKESYSLIQNSISSSGFKLVDSEIENNEVISTYQNAFFTLKVSTEKRTDNNFISASTIAYTIILIKKGGVYDPENGRKTEYYDDNSKKVEYTLKDGNIDGALTVFYRDGSVKMKKSYVDGKANGKFIEYDEAGNVSVEYHMLDDKQNNLLKIYKDGKLSYTTNFLNDQKHGKHKEYYYDNESGKVNLRLEGEYFENEKDGTWTVYYINDNQERIITYNHYSNGIKNGDFQEVTGDSLIIGKYQKGEIHGEYKIYRDLMRAFNNTVIRTDTSQLILITHGHYSNNLKSGKWKYYDLTGTLLNEGKYLNGNKTGAWKNYYPKYVDQNTKQTLPYAEKLFLVQNYSNGKLNGKSTRYSYLNEEEYLCDEKKKIINRSDTCVRLAYHIILETSFYNEDKLHGPYQLLDSSRNIVAKGYFKNNLKDGEWVQRYIDKYINDEITYIYEKGEYEKDKREGKWVEYKKEDKIAKKFSYYNGKLHGEYITSNQYGNPKEKKLFRFGRLKELIVYDSLGQKPINKFEIYNERRSGYRCKWIVYHKNGYNSQEYWVETDEEIQHKKFQHTFITAINENTSRVYRDGDYELFDHNDMPIILGEYFRQNRKGTWTHYYYNQNVKIKSKYDQDELINEVYFDLNDNPYSGKFTYSDKENGIIEVRKIKNGLRNGKTVYRDLKTNEVLKKEKYRDGKLKS